MKKNFYAKQLSLLFIVLLFPALTFGQIYSNTFTGVSACPTPGNVATAIPGVTGTELTRSTITCTPFANAFNSTTLNNTATINNNSYIEFSVTADAGYQLNVTSLSFFRQGSASAPNQLEIRYSTDGFATSTAWGAAPATLTSPGATTIWNFDDFTVASGVKLTFRIYPYGSQRADLSANTASAGASFRLDNVILNGTAINPMPVKLIAFEGNYDSNRIILNWSTAWEEQNEGFEIQKGTDAVNFYKIGYVEGNSTTSLKSAYQFTDPEIQPGKDLYFRLKQIDRDGTYTYSRIIAINTANEKGEFLAYPNPSNGSFQLKSSEIKNGEIHLFNALGQEIPVKIGRSDVSDTFLINVKGSAAPGLYELRINNVSDNAKPKTVKISIN